MEPFDLILLSSLAFSLIALAFPLRLHEKKIESILKNAGLIEKDTKGKELREELRNKRTIIQISDPNISMLGRSWILAFAALFFIGAMSIILRTSLISGGILIFISIILSSLLIAWLFGLRIPVFRREFKHPEVPLRRCYQECSISKRDYYKNLYGVSFVLAIFSILFAFWSYVIPYYRGSFSILEIHIFGLYLHSFASVLFAICLVLLVSPMLRLSDWGGLFLIYVKRLARWRKQKIF